jgi:hypothetical protein
VAVVVILVHQTLLEPVVVLAVAERDQLIRLVEQAQQIKVLQVQGLHHYKVVEVAVLAKLATLMVLVKVEMVYQQLLLVHLLLTLVELVVAVLIQ